MLTLRHVLIQSGQLLPVLVERLEMEEICGDLCGHDHVVGEFLNRFVVWFLVRGVPKLLEKSNTEVPKLLEKSNTEGWIFLRGFLRWIRSSCS